MWTCPKCGKQFNHANQNHFCQKLSTIDEYIDAQNENVRPYLKKVRSVIKEILPDAKEKISWQMPTFYQYENVVHFAAQKNHLGFYPGDLSSFPHKEKLENVDNSKGTVRFPYAEIDYDLIRCIVKWRLHEIINKHRK